MKKSNNFCLYNIGSIAGLGIGFKLYFGGETGIGVLIEDETGIWVEFAFIGTGILLGQESYSSLFRRLVVEDRTFDPLLTLFLSLSDFCLLFVVDRE